MKWVEFTGKRQYLRLLQLLIVILAVAATTPSVFGYNDYEYYDTANETDSNFRQLILDIVVDETGKALVTGYVEHRDIDNLSFLETSDYLYDKDTNQLYALTHALTCKYEDDWIIKLTTSAFSYYTDYHTVFYLPGDVKLGRINCSYGLDYFVTASNESFVIDVYGYDVESPITSIEYQQPITETGVGGSSFNFVYLLLVIAISGLTLALVIAIIKMKKGEDAHHKVEGKIATNSNMARVMETLTERERTIVNALLKHNGEMTQADLRYETGIPKSSLTGILRSLERRKIINKKEWGRTNVIELSKWFLSEKG